MNNKDPTITEKMPRMEKLPPRSGDKGELSYHAIVLLLAVPSKNPNSLHLSKKYSNYFSSCSQHILPSLFSPFLPDSLPLTSLPTEYFENYLICPLTETD